VTAEPPSPPGPAGPSEDRAWRLVLVIVAVSTLARLAYTVFLIDYAALRSPEWGPDSPVYSNAAAALHAHGLFTGGMEGIPFWPAGYPVFIAAVYSLTGLGTIALFVVQQLALSATMLLAYRLATRELSPAAGVGAVLMLAVSPALGLSASTFMYEPLLALCAVACADLASRAVHRPPGARRTSALAGAFLVAGLGATLQPKLLPAGAAVALWAMWRTRQVAVPLLCALAMAIGPAALVVRNWKAGDGVVLSANLGFTLLTGANDHADGGYVDDQVAAATCGGRDSSLDPSLDAQWRDCALDWMRRHPMRTVLLTVPKAAHLWLPFSGTLGRRGTWQHALDHHRWLPDAWLRNRLFHVVDTAAGALWAAGALGLLLLGFARALRDPGTRAAAVLLAAPVVVFTLISMATIGDARFRLPVAPFASAFIAYALLPMIDRAGRTRRATTASRPRCDPPLRCRPAPRSTHGL